MCLFLYCDPSGRPYNFCDFVEPLKALGLNHDIAGLGPVQGRWLLKLKTTEALQTLAKAGSMLVKGRYCAVVEPGVEEIWMKVNWVPFNISNASLREALQEFGIVKKVSCYKWSTDEDVLNRTDRHVRLRLKEGMKSKDLPHLWTYRGVTLLFVVPDRPPMCEKCNNTGHLSLHCTAPRCSKCQAYGHTTCERSVEPEETQVTPTAACEEACTFESKQEPAAVTETTDEHPVEVSTGTETSNIDCERESGFESKQEPAA
ncbi:uncharacterized protein LOC125941449 [Dermacentor silvarum]|uniref:uncharacterized protein LOC125941449 n=1 Tax=Dermacentor silvarum TaxID=543639 RepID=UPI002101434C|nr:uncharacterized protein LOC125941449 [Dermacentor silvarum]